MGGTAPICPFCKKNCVLVKPHIKDVHPDKYEKWIKDGQQPYWRYNDKGELNVTTRKR